MNVSRRNASANYSMPRVLREKLNVRDLRVPLGKIARSHFVTLGECFSPSRKKHIVRARHALWQHLRDEGWSYAGIGDLFGMDHTSVRAALLSASLASADCDAIAEAAE